jgi:hypothetical protein
LVIYRSVLWESWLVCANGYIPPIYHVMYKPIFVVLMGLLIVLHFIWFSMFLRMGYILVCKGEAHDLSEHKKGERTHHQPKTTTTTKPIPINDVTRIQNGNGIKKYN